MLEFPPPPLFDTVSRFPGIFGEPILDLYIYDNAVRK